MRDTDGGPADPADPIDGADHPATADHTAWCGVRFRPGDVPAIVVRERVRLHDTDSSGLIYYGAVAPWLTRAQSELWLALGFRQESRLPSPMMPVVNVELDYLGPLALGDAYELVAWIDEAGSTSLTVAFTVELDGRPRARARMTHVHLDVDTGRPAPLPAAMVAAARARRG